MTDDQRQGCGPATFLMNKVQVDAFDRRNKVGKAIDDGLLCAPVEFI